MWLGAGRKEVSNESEESVKRKSHFSIVHILLQS